MQEERLGSHKEEGSTDGIDQSYRPEGCCIAQVFCNDAAQQDAQSHTHIPRYQDGGVGRSTLAVVSHADGHILESRPHVAVA